MFEVFYDIFSDVLKESVSLEMKLVRSFSFSLGCVKFSEVLLFY